MKEWIDIYIKGRNVPKGSMGLFYYCWFSILLLISLALIVFVVEISNIL